jgi:hypothetical protein
VGGDGRCGVLQHRRGKGVRKLQEIAGIAAREGAHRGVADGGGAWPESVREKGMPVAEGGGLGAGSGGEARALEWRGRRGVEMGGRVGAVALERRGHRRSREGGPAAEVPRGVGRHRGAWPRLAGGAPSVSRSAATRMRRARAARRCSDSGTLAPIGRAPVAARARRHGWRTGVRGPAREESGVAEPR